MLGEEEEAEDPCKRQWLSNYELNEVNIFSLFDEFLEMGTWSRGSRRRDAGAEPRVPLAWREPDDGEPKHRQGKALRRAPPALAHQDHPQMREQAMAWPWAPARTLLSSCSAKRVAVTPSSTCAQWDPHRSPSPTALSEVGVPKTGLYPPFTPAKPLWHKPPGRTNPMGCLWCGGCTPAPHCPSQ